MGVGGSDLHSVMFSEPSITPGLSKSAVWNTDRLWLT